MRRPDLDFPPVIIVATALLLLGATGYVIYESFKGYRKKIDAEDLWLAQLNSQQVPLQDPGEWVHLLRIMHPWVYPWGPSRQAWKELQIFAIGDAGLMERANALEFLLTMLDNEDSEIAADAARKLEYSNDDRAVGPLIVALKQGSLDTRRASAVNLGEMGNGRALEALIGCLKDQDPSVVEKAAEALGRLGDARAVEPLILALSYKWVDVRREAALALGRLEDPRASQALIPCLNDVPAVASAAAAALGRLRNVKATESLMAALKHENSDVRASAASALGELRDSRAVATLVTILKDPVPETAAAAAKALARIRDRSSLEPLLEASRNGNTQVRRAAIRSLGYLGDNKTLESLSGFLMDPDTSVVFTSSLVLASSGDSRGVRPLVSNLQPLFIDEATRGKVLQALGEVHDNNTSQQLIACLKSGSTFAKGLCSEVLGENGDRNAVQSLIILLQDKDQVVRATAAEALGKIGDKEALEALITSLQDSDIVFRISAANALGFLGDGKAIWPLIQALKDQHYQVRIEACLALSLFEDPRVPEVLLSALQDPSWKVRDCLVEILGRVPSERSRKVIHEALKDTYSWNRVRAVFALQLDPEAAPLLCTALKDDVWYVRNKAARMLACTPGTEHIQPLRLALSDGHKTVRLQAAVSLSLCGDNEGFEFLLQELQGQDFAELDLEEADYQLAGLAVLDRDELLPHLVRTLETQGSQWRFPATLALSRLSTERVRQALLECPFAFRIGRDLDRIEKLIALREIAKTGDLDRLRDFVSDDDPAVSILACGFGFETNPEDMADRGASWFQDKPFNIRLASWKTLLAYGDLMPDRFHASLEGRVKPVWARGIRALRPYWEFRRNH